MKDLSIKINYVTEKIFKSLADMYFNGSVISTTIEFCRFVRLRYNIDAVDTSTWVMQGLAEEFKSTIEETFNVTEKPVTESRDPKAVEPSQEQPLIEAMKKKAPPRGHVSQVMVPETLNAIEDLDKLNKILDKNHYDELWSSYL